MPAPLAVQVREIRERIDTGAPLEGSAGGGGGAGEQVEKRSEDVHSRSLAEALMQVPRNSPASSKRALLKSRTPSKKVPY